MKKQIIASVFLMLAGIFVSASVVDSFKEGQLYHGFRLKEKRFVQEVNADCLHFIHEQSGAQVLKIAADDPNKLVNISFRTIPHDNTGVAHIMEHAVLNGSKNFPVRSPFEVLIQGSLHTFLNAMTGPESTRYPVSSMNEQDYFNLMHVYLDAVFYPNIYDEPRIFLQEGWHYELNDIEDDIVYRGVVFNEMKGAYSDHRRQLVFHVNRTLFPDNTFGVCSGGYPEEIPDLSYEAFLDFHRTFYHPSNSHILLYGDADLDKELAFIHEEYLSGFQRSDQVFEIERQRPFEQMKVKEVPYAVPAGSDTEDNTFLTLSFAAGTGTDLNHIQSLRILASVLVNNETAPLRLALQEAGLGRNVEAWVLGGVENLFLIRVQDANTRDLEKFKEVVFATMQKVLEEGFDKEDLQGIINQTIFSMREGNTPNKGLMYMSLNNLNWLYDHDPFAGLQFEEQLSHISKALHTPLLEELMREYLLENPHALLMALYPEPGLEAKMAARERERLDQYQAGLTLEDRKALVEQTRELRAFQQRQDTPEALATIPMLSLDDLSPDINWFDLEKKELHQVPVMHYNAFTNDILYVNMFFDMRALPHELIPYARLLSTIIREVGTKEKTFGQINNAFNIHTGGFWTYLTSLLENQSDDQLLPYFVAGGKVTADQAGHFFSLAHETLAHFDLEDTQRLKTVLTRHKAQLEANLTNDGFRVALRRLESYYSQKGMFDEMTQGLTYIEFVRDLFDNFEQQADHIVEKLQHTARLLFDLDNMMVQVSCSHENYADFVSGFEHMLPLRTASVPERYTWSFDHPEPGEGLSSSSRVQYVLQGYDFSKLGYTYDGKMQVLSQIISTVYLQNRIRVIGGAYGGWSNVNASGQMYFASYRDPNLAETLNNYQGVIDFIAGFEADPQTMTRFIIGTIASLDRPMTVSSQGLTAMHRYLQNIQPEDLKKERAAILSATSQDMAAYKDMLQAIISQNVYCVYGNEEKISENRDLFKKLLDITL